MRESLSDFIASTAEFIIGGVVLAFAVLFVIYTFGGLPDRPLASGTGQIGITSQAAGLLLALALAYAIGIIAEDFSRWLCEPILVKITEAKLCNYSDPAGERERRRMATLSSGSPVYSEVQSQLRRLRVERVVWLAT